jgi:Protein of unknown function (DUF1838)
MPVQVSRRKLIASAPLGLAAMAGAPALAARRRPNPSRAVPTDPAARARMRARIIGSTAEETTWIFYRLNIYGFAGGQLIPFFTMNHLSVNQWKPVAADQFSTRTFECGVYCRFDTDEPLEYWDNPVTGERRKVWQFLGGPFQVTIGADGIVTRGAELDPKTLRMEALGGMVVVPTAASMVRPNPVDPAKWPKLYAGPRVFWESQATYAATQDQAFDEGLSAADSFCHFQNLGSWHPWLGMGQQEGRTYGNSHGAKLRSLDGIPLAARRTLEKHTPQIFDTASWTKPRMDIPEYLANPQP